MAFFKYLLLFSSLIMKSKPDQENPVLLIIGGSSDDSTVLNTTLVVSLENNYDCNIGDLGFRTFGAIGGYVGSKMIYCGGFCGYQCYSSRCYSYESKNNTWNKFESMKRSRYWGAYVNTPKGFAQKILFF